MPQQKERPLMPKATAVWLVDNTTLTFEQIADFCGLHPLEVKGIADEDVAKGIKGIDPVVAGQLTREQIDEAEQDPSRRLEIAQPKYKLPHGKQKKTPRYTPVSKRQDKPDAIYWLLRNHPELTDADVVRLIGTTKATIAKIRERGHWNSPNIKAVDPVTLGLCTQIELDAAVQRAARRKPATRAKKAAVTLKPVEVTTAEPPPAEEPAESPPGEVAAELTPAEEPAATPPAEKAQEPQPAEESPASSDDVAREEEAQHDNHKEHSEG
ncbi:MAG: DUF1013 domain-containing protein [Alphaproteobacteria bacterium]